MEISFLVKIVTGEEKAEIDIGPNESLSSGIIIEARIYLKNL